MKRILILVLLILSSVLSASAAWAEDEKSVKTAKMEEVVVTASKIEEAASETTSGVVVITQEDIKNTRAQFLPDVLRQVPELNVVQNGGQGHLATVRLRGGNSEHTLVMIDGVKVNDPNFGGFDFSGLAVDDIERIEIVKGPQSTIYGSEAMAGVINIITKHGRGKAKVDASFEGGSHKTYNPSIGISGGGEGYDYRLTSSYYRTDGISAAKSGKEDDGYRQSFVSGKFGLRGKKSELEVSGRYAYNRRDLDAYIFDFATFTSTFGDDPNYVERENNYTLSGKGKLYLTDKWEQVLTLSRAWDHLKGSDPDTAFNNYGFETGIDTVDYQHNVYASEYYTATAGIEYRKEKSESSGDFGFPQKTVDNKAFYLNNKVKKGAAVFTAGLRHDNHETFGEETTYRAGAVYKVSTTTDMRVSYGTGFRAPTLNNLFAPGFGNINLKPEKSKSWEVGIEERTDTASTSLTYFEQDYENLISGFPPENINEAKVKGVEAGSQVKISSGSYLKAGYTYLDTEDKATGKRLPFRPKHKFTAGAGFSEDGASLGAEYLYVGGRLDNTGATTKDLKPYGIVNLSGGYKLSDNFDLFARVENLLDRDYEEISGYSTYGRSYYGGLRASF